MTMTKYAQVALLMTSTILIGAAYDFYITLMFLGLTIIINEATKGEGEEG